jgi:exosortase/archaeosortase family protein
MKNKEAFGLFARYFVLLLLGLFNLKLIYAVFAPLTIRPAFGIILLIYDNAALLWDNVLFFNGSYIQIISACVAGAAYYLLLILNLSTPMRTGKRTKSLLFVLTVFLVLNIARIVAFAVLSASGSQYFDLTHKLTWYFGSTLMVVMIWFVNVRLFKIKDIPVYTDAKKIYEDTYLKRK